MFNQRTCFQMLFLHLKIQSAQKQEFMAADTKINFTKKNAKAAGYSFWLFPLLGPAQVFACL